MKKTILIAGALAIAGLQAGVAQAADEAAYTAACASAEEARKMAAELKFEWNTIGPLMEKAKKAAADGDFAKAVKLCDTARKHGELGVAQAKEQGEAWKAAVVK